MNRILSLLLLLIPFCGVAQHFTNYDLRRMQKPSGGGGRTSHWRTITIPNSNVSGGSDLTAFPMTIQGTFTYLKTVANGGKVQNSNAYDVLLAADNAGATLLKWEVENYNPATGDITIHVRIPTLSASSNTVIYLIYDSVGITTFQGGAAGSVWDANFTNVYHFNEILTGSGQTVHDYTSNTHNFTSNGTWSSTQQAAGQLGGALSFIETNGDWLNATSQSFASTYTIEGWYFEPGTGAPTGGIWMSDNAEATQMGFDNNGFFGLQGPSKTTDSAVSSKGVWYYFVVTRNGTNDQFFRNGIPQVLGTTNGVDFSFAAIGAGLSGGDLSDNMTADEERISNVVRTNGWIATTYTDQSSPGTFSTIGTEN